MRLVALLPCFLVSTLLTACGGAGNESVGSDATTGVSTGATTDATTGATTGDLTTGDQPTGPDASTSTDTGDAGTTAEPEPPAPEVLYVLEDVVFYDGYAGTVDEPVPPGVIRHSNALNAIRFTDEQLAKIQDTLQLGVIVGALCDNYDRIGSVNLALVPKGAATYVPAEVQRLELARFITPFMNMNKEPRTVPYQWNADNVVAILKDEDLRAEYDFWFELFIFGVPYAANTEVPGCADRNDTQLGTLLLHTDSTKEPEPFTTLLPLAISEPFNNYTEGATDMVGLTRKTIAFTLPEDTQAAQLVLITSNHGANAGGEEYVRRLHNVYVDEQLVLQYTPGRTSCEPFRMYNTQGNGIYGGSAKSDEEWQSFSNWCPGDVIDTRIVPIGPRSAGVHSFVIDVPKAAFTGGQGDFPFSLYVQAQ